MKNTLPVLVCALLSALNAIPRPCQADDAARALIDKAIEAVGGAEKLAKHNAMTWEETGTYYGMGTGLPYTGRHAIQWPNQFRMEIEGVFTMVLNGDKAWTKTNDMTVELPAEQLKQQQDNHYAGWVSSLLPLRDPAFQLSMIGEHDVAGNPAVGVKVKREGKPEVDLFFDKATGRLVKSKNRAVSTEQGGKEVDQETLYDKFEKVDGVLVPKLIVVTHDGEKLVESEPTKIKAHGKLDDSVFGKP